jgi:hypothetical protein
MLRVWNQAKQAAHFGPPISISFPEELGIQMHRPPSKKTTKGPQIGHSYLMQTHMGLKGSRVLVLGSQR